MPKLKQPENKIIVEVDFSKSPELLKRLQQTADLCNKDLSEQILLSAAAGFAEDRLCRCLTESEAALSLGFDKATLNNWRHRGRGPQYIKIDGKSVRYPVPYLEAFILANTNRTADMPDRPTLKLAAGEEQ